MEMSMEGVTWGWNYFIQFENRPSPKTHSNDEIPKQRSHKYVHKRGMLKRLNIKKERERFVLIMKSTRCAVQNIPILFE